MAQKAVTYFRLINYKVHIIVVITDMIEPFIYYSNRVVLIVVNANPAAVHNILACPQSM